MNNSYERQEVFEFGRAQSLIQGEKVMDPMFCDAELGCGFRTLQTDVDESDE